MNIRRLFKSFGWAWTGLREALKTQQNFRFHVVATALVIILGFYIGLSSTSWAIIILCLGFVLSAELFNTAIEKLSDEVANGQERRLIKHTKDIAAAAVLVSAIASLIVGIVLLFIPFLQKIAE
jgi:diacylglycerol kinase (ATP)